jgi:hypothetical protein
MKNFVSVALLAAAVSATACGTSTPDPVDTSAVITAHWSFSTYDTFAHNGAPTDPCPAGFDTAAVHARPWDPFLGQFTASDMPPDKFNCSDKGGTTDPLDGIFQVWVSITDHSGGTVYAQSESVIIDTADGDSTITLPTLYKDAGFADFSWDLVRGNTRLHCSEAGITSSGYIGSTSVSVTSPSFMALDKFTCEDGFGITSPLPDDDYDMTLTAVAKPGTDIGVSDPQPDITITAPNGLTHVGHVKIPVQ